MRRLFLLSSLFFACGPAPELTQPFIHVTLTDPAGFTAPAANRLEFTTTSTVGGDVLTRTFTADIAGNALPTDFVVQFSEAVRGEAVDISVAGFLDDVNVFSASGSAIADVSEMTLPASFCGDNEIDAIRQETCDDGSANADGAPNACRTSCLLPVCGDGVLDSDTEGCDDGNNIDADGCEADCSLPACSNGIFELEDFNSSNTGCFTNLSQSFDVPDLSSKLLVVDINNDGNLDIVSGFLSQQFIFISFGNGDGSFQAAQIIAMPSGTSSIAIANLSTTDNFIDIVATGTDIGPIPEVGKLTNTTGTNFSPSVLVNVQNATNGTTFANIVGAGDFNEDGGTEILIGSNALYKLNPFNQNDTIQLPIVQQLANNDIFFNEASDINSDGNLDIIFVDVLNQNNRANFLRGRGDGTFQNLISVPIGLNFRDAEFIDFDSNGLDDTVLCLTDKIQVITDIFTGNSIQRQFSCLSLEKEDFDLDQKPDLFIVQSLSFISIILSSENYTNERVFFTKNLGFAGIGAIGAGDLNKDGFTDIVLGGVTINQDNKIEVLLFDK